MLWVGKNYPERKKNSYDASILKNSKKIWDSGYQADWVEQFQVTWSPRAIAFRHNTATANDCTARSASLSSLLLLLLLPLWAPSIVLQVNSGEWINSLHSGRPPLFYKWTVESELIHSPLLVGSDSTGQDQNGWAGSGHSKKILSKKLVTFLCIFLSNFCLILICILYCKDTNPVSKYPIFSGML
jgi:hypothetical protein